MQEKITLKEAIQKHVASITLENSRLQQLLAMQQTALKSKTPHYKKTLWLAAATLVIAISVLFLWQKQAVMNRDYSYDIALEVVNNHIKLKHLDIETNSINEIRRFFSQLDFSPIDSNLLKTRADFSEQTMLGGRYCSIKGMTAAQLRYRQADDRPTTLYEVSYNPKIFGKIPELDKGEKPKELVVKGLRVSLWVEKGLLLALVHTANEY